MRLSLFRRSPAEADNMAEMRHTPHGHRLLLTLLAMVGTAIAQPGSEAPRMSERWPYGLGAAPEAFSRPVSRARLELGRDLFFDPILSADRSVSCATCHQPEHGFASPEPLPPGAAGKRALRNAPSLYNRVLGALHSWDGRARSLEEQVVMPISDPNEMGLPLRDALARLGEDTSYARRFRQEFGRAPDRDDLADALASFVRRLTMGDSPVDRFQGAKDRTLLTLEERAGLWLYESKGRCWICHSGPNFSDERFHNTGVGVKAAVPEPGRMAITDEEGDRGAFRTPTLRGLVYTAPYMHDGSIKTLREVVEFYARGGNPNPALDKELKPLSLTPREVDHLVAFLKALSRSADR